MASTVSTQILVISDTHADDMSIDLEADVAIHCGDLTEESQIGEFQKSLDLLMRIKAPLKLVIAGNHDFTMDDDIFKKKVIDSKIEDDLVAKTYGAIGSAKAMFRTEEAQKAGIVFLDEGIHKFELTNGANLTVYASPYTPGVSEWGFQYSPQEGHAWNVGSADIAITHCPPRGVLDYTDSKQRAGCPQLFQAIATARPLMHCFGHIHESWGAKKVAWRSEENSLTSDTSHFTAIDNDKSNLVENLAGLKARKWDSEETRLEKASRLAQYQRNGCCEWAGKLERGTETLFVNAAIEGEHEGSQHLPWVVQLDLPRREQSPSHKLEANRKKKASVSEDAAEEVKPTKSARLANN